MEGIEGWSMKGPHTYKLAKELAAKRNIRIIVYKNNMIKHAFPKKFDGEKMQIALLESTSCYIEGGQLRRHIDFFTKTKTIL